MIDVRLNTLLKVYETGSYSRAAEILSLTQPAVSQHIHHLEEELGIKLFRRGEGGMKLTTEGLIALKYARRICTMYQNLLSTLEDQKNSLTRFSVGVTHTSESNLITEVLARYCNEKESMRLTLCTDTISNLYDKLRAYEIDLAIVEGKMSDEAFSSILLDTDCLMLVVAPDSPLAKKSMVTLSELKKEKMILRLPNSGTRNLFVSHLESNNVSIDDFNVILEADNIATIKDLIRRDFGVSILARSTCMDEVRKGKLCILPVENLPMIREINMVYQKDFAHPEVLQGIARLYYEMSSRYAAK